jgi:murein DD-endopeptidase MepM/ murein hydrolase activator NlpD
VLLLFLILITLPLLARASSAAGGASRKSWSVRWQPVRLVNGAPIEFRVTPPVRLESLAGEWFEHQVFFSLNPRTKGWYGIAGVSVGTRPGAYVLRLKGKTRAGQEIVFERKIAVHAARYPSIAVRVAAKFTEPSPEQLKQIKLATDVKAEVFRHVEPEREWSGKFRAPVTARVSDLFGTRRVFNGETKSVHEGLDYAVPPGTPVAAVNAGSVILARPLYFEGNCIVLDHGQGLLTLYMHLSKFNVKEGDQVKRGEIIGLSGGTGRATGPHLHLAVRWQGVYVNPATLLELNLP